MRRISICSPSGSLVYVVVDVVLVVVASRRSCQARQHQRHRDAASLNRWQFPWFRLYVSRHVVQSAHLRASGKIWVYDLVSGTRRLAMFLGESFQRAAERERVRRERTGGLFSVSHNWAQLTRINSLGSRDWEDSTWNLADLWLVCCSTCLCIPLQQLVDGFSLA